MNMQTKAAYVRSSSFVLVIYITHMKGILLIYIDITSDLTSASRKGDGGAAEGC